MKLAKEDSLPTITPPPSPPPLLLPSLPSLLKRENSETTLLFGKDRYKFWALAALLLLALWSMFAGSVTLKSSPGNPLPSSDEVISATAAVDDVDVLDVAEREKVVRHLWTVYTLAAGSKIRLPRFWQEAFQAAYDCLISDVPAVRDGAISEIARMSLRSVDLRSQHPVQSTET
ncbi:hypothetical protein Dimus_002331 [Dionaea muscipula]